MDSERQPLAYVVETEQLSNFSDVASLEEGRDACDAPQRAWRKRSVAIAFSLAVLVVVGRGVMQRNSPLSSSNSLNDSSKKYAVAQITKSQPSWQISSTERDLCSSDKDNCFHTQCCKVAGHKCYLTGDAVAKCMEYCTIGKDSADCTQLQNSQTMQIESPDTKQHPAETMFCFSVYTNNTGTPKKSYELDLLTQQRAKTVSIFACDASAVYSDVSVSLGEGASTIKVVDNDGDFHFAHRKKEGGELGPWVNTGMFKQVWKAIGASATYKKYDWTVKADPDAVFLPARLKPRVRWMMRPTNGLILTNCRHVDYGFFGNLEVFSSMAFSILVANVDKCSDTLPWKVGIKNGKYGPMGEDLFAEICLEKNGVSKADAFDITIDGACPGDRPYDQIENKHWQFGCDKTSAAAMHPFKKPSEWFACYSKTTGE